MQVAFLGSLKKADTYATLYFSALSERAPNKQRRNNMQQFQIREITTLKPYFD